MGAKRFGKTAVVLALGLLAAWPARAFGATYTMSYSGRMADASGKPIEGPVDMTVKFFRSAAGTDQVAVGPLTLSAVPLDDGVFILPLQLADTDFHTLFPDLSTPVYIEVTDVTHGRTFTRQTLSPVPYALKVPVDNNTITYNNQGQLTLAGASAGGNVLSAINATTGTLSGSLLPPLAGDVAGPVNATVVGGLAGRPLASMAPNNGDVLKWNGSSWAPGGVAGASADWGGGPLSNVGSLSIGTTAAGTDLFFAPGGGRTIAVGAQPTAGSSLTIAAGSTTNAGLNGGNLVLASGDTSGAGGSSQIQLQTSASGATTNAVTILGNGSVGIGTTTPAGALDVEGGTASNANGVPIILNAQNGNGFGHSGGSIILMPGSSGGASAPAGVGIGTTSPGSVNPAGFPNPDQVLELKVPSFSTNNAEILLRRQDNFIGLDITADINNTGSIFLDSRYNSSTYGGFRFRTQTNATPRDVLTIQGSGNVGIGTTTPLTPLDVVTQGPPGGPVVDVRNYDGTSISGPGLQFTRSRGTSDATADDIDTDYSMWIQSSAMSGGSNYVHTRIDAAVDGTFTSGQMPPGRLAFSTAAANGLLTERLRITSSGSVGIGTGTPGAKLEVNGDIKISSGSGGVITFADGTTQSTAAGAGSANWGGGALDNVGNLSIGTTAPGTDLFFGGSANRTISVGAQAAAGSDLTVQAGGSSANGDNGGNLVLASGATSGGTASSQIQLQTSDNGSTTNAMTILGNGNVGIGTTSPSQLLHVSGGAGTIAATRISAYSDAYYTDIIENADGTASTTINAQGTAPANMLQLQVNGSAVETLNGSGNVGIGTTTPQGFLDVEAGTAASGSGLPIILTAQGAPMGGHGGNIILMPGASVEGESGWVGIGTTSPVGFLDVEGGEPDNGDGGNIIINAPSATAGFNAGNIFLNPGTTPMIGGGTQGMLGIGTTHPVGFLDVEGSGGVILHAGNVGIGTTSPGATLDVSGTAKIGAAGTAFTATGVCTIASTAITNTAADYACTGVPASTAVAVWCSGNADMTNPDGTGVYCRATGAADQVKCTTTAINSVAMDWTCQWIQP